VVALGTFIGLVVGVVVAGGGIGLAHIGALSLHLAFFGWAVGACSLALAATTGRRALASGVAAAFALLGFLLNGLAPLVDSIEWLKYLSLFYYYEGHDPIGNGVDAGDLAVLGAATLALTAVAVAGLRQRDLRK
jgi:ABC-2 type transport system permease protein